MKKNIFFTVLLVFLPMIVLMGCGKKGAPLPPENSTYDYPGSYP